MKLQFVNDHEIEIESIMVRSIYEGHSSNPKSGILASDLLLYTEIEFIYLSFNLRVQAGISVAGEGSLFAQQGYKDCAGKLQLYTITPNITEGAIIVCKSHHFKNQKSSVHIYFFIYFLTQMGLIPFQDKTRTH